MTLTVLVYLFAYADGVSKAPFHVLSDGQVEYTKALFLGSKAGETSLSIYICMVQINL